MSAFEDLTVRQQKAVLYVATKQARGSMEQLIEEIEAVHNVKRDQELTHDQAAFLQNYANAKISEFCEVIASEPRRIEQSVEVYEKDRGDFHYGVLLAAKGPRDSFAKQAQSTRLLEDHLEAHLDETLRAGELLTTNKGHEL